MLASGRVLADLDSYNNGHGLFVVSTISNSTFTRPSAGEISVLQLSG